MPGMWVLTLHKDAQEFLLAVFHGRSPSGHSDSASCPVPSFSLLIMSIGAAEMKFFSPGLAGGMWVSAWMGWKSVPEGRLWEWDVELSRVMFSGTAGTHGLSYRVETPRQVMIIRRVLGFSACSFIFYFFPPPPSRFSALFFPLPLVLM